MMINGWTDQTDDNNKLGNDTDNVKPSQLDEFNRNQTMLPDNIENNVVNHI